MGGHQIDRQRSWQRLDRRQQHVGEVVDVGRRQLAGEDQREDQLGQREGLGEPLELGLLAVASPDAEPGGLGQRTRRQLVEQGLEPGMGRRNGVDDDRREGDRYPVLQRVGRLDQLVHRGLLGERDEQHLAALRVGEHRRDLRRLDLDRAAVDRLEQGRGGLEERDRVARRRPVEDDQVEVARPFELFDLAEDEDVLDPRGGGGDDVEHARAGQSLGDQPESMTFEVVPEGTSGGQRAARDPSRAALTEAVDQSRLVVTELVSDAAAEQAGKSGATLDVDHEHAQPATSCGTSEHSRYRCLADPALAGDDDQPGRGEELVSIHASPGGRNVRRLAIALIAVGAALCLGAAPRAGAQSSASAPSPDPTVEPGVAALAADLPPVDVFEVSGLLDGILVDEIGKAIERAETDGAQALILQMNSKQAVVSRERIAALAVRIHDADVPVAIWVGPSGARAYGLPGQLIGAAAASGVAPGSRIGKFGERLSIDGTPLDFGEANDELATGTLGYLDARSLGAISLPDGLPDAVVLRNMIQALDGLEYHGTTLDTIVDLVAADGTVESTSTTPRFFKLNLIPRFFHTVASPPVAYLLFVIGAALLVFEFFTAGVGVAGVIGVFCLVFGSYGFGALPIRGWAVALLIAAMVAFAVDVQVGVPRFWTGLGMLVFTFGSVVLFRDGIRLSWITLVVGIAGMGFTFVVGMPSMVRTRFATPTIGRDWMIGETGAAVADISPNGVVEVNGGTWRARTNRATPIAAGDEVKVVAIDGVTLEVEPVGGGARDYREHRPKS